MTAYIVSLTDHVTLKLFASTNSFTLGGISHCIALLFKKLLGESMSCRAYFFHSKNALLLVCWDNMAAQTPALWVVMHSLFTDILQFLSGPCDLDRLLSVVNIVAKLTLY